jgi:chaperonin GroES
VAEVEQIPEEPLEPIETDVLPDGVEKTPDLPLFNFLDAGNLVGKLKNDTQVASDVLRLLGDAERSMSDWQKKYDTALKLAKLEAETEKKTFPFEDASTVMMPFITEAMLDFHARVVPELVWSKKVVAIKAWGRQTKEKDDRADRVSTFMNYQLTELIKTWRKEQDKMLLGLPCVGTAYKKTCYDQDEQEVASDLLQADEVKFDHSYKTFDDAPDKFINEEYTRNECIEFIRGAMEWGLKEDDLPKERDHSEPFEFVRAFTWLDLDGDDLTEPYEVVVYKETQRVVSVYPAFDEDDIVTNDDGEIVKVAMARIFTQYQFLPDPEGGPMGMGWGILLGDMFDSLNTTVRQMIDAGTLANIAGSSGLIEHQLSGSSARGNRMQAGPVEVRMGELTPITTGGKSLRESIVQFPYQGPNQALFMLTDWMLKQVRSMTNSALNMETNGQEAAMMYLARLQQGLKVPNSIVMRVYNSAKEEFAKIAALNFKHYSNKKYNKVLDGEQPADMHADFNPDDCDIRTATEPSQGSDIERQGRATVILEEAKTQPQQILNLREAYLDWLDALKVTDLDRLAPEPSGEPDPMEQLMRANLAREAELADREMNIKEAKLNLEQMDAMMEGMRKGAEFGLKLDKTEAEISVAYADAMKSLWEIGMAGDDPVETVQNIETRLIDKKGAAVPPVPIDSPNPNAPAP